MSPKIDQSLDEIAKSRRQSGGRTNRRRSAVAAKAAATRAPVGGVKKTTKTAKGAGKGATIGLTAPLTESKIIVSGLVSLFS
jgi:THO complex subunit 4